MKVCTQCATSKPESEFYRRYNRPTGYQSCCKTCFALYTHSEHNVRVDALLALGGECMRCGFDDIRALQIDHVDGGGNQDVLALGSRYRLYAKIRDGYDEGYQLLCANCNAIKRYTNNEMPHQGIPIPEQTLR